MRNNFRSCFSLHRKCSLYLRRDTKVTLINILIKFPRKETLAVSLIQKRKEEKLEWEDGQPAIMPLRMAYSNRSTQQIKC